MIRGIQQALIIINPFFFSLAAHAVVIVNFHRNMMAIVVPLHIVIQAQIVTQTLKEIDVGKNDDRAEGCLGIFLFLSTA